jgi:hypothetical protein
MEQVDSNPKNRMNDGKKRGREGYPLIAHEIEWGI